MELDRTNRYRSILESDLPGFISKVNAPWDNLPDYVDFNAAAYRRITRDLQRLNKAREEGCATSKGILVLGEAGTGKTHLLMRAAKNLANTNHILFVRRPTVEDAVAQHVWAEIVRSLSQVVPSSCTTRSQLDELLVHVFFSMLLPEFERDIQQGKDTVRTQRWADALREDPYNLFDMLGDGESRNANMKTIRHRTLRYLQQKHPDVDQQIAYALITYCFVSRDNDKRIILAWLSGQEMDVQEAKRVGLPPQWIDIEDGATDISVQQRREAQALRAIRTIGILSTYFQPLILAFDQLEGLRDEPRLTQRWGDVVKEIFTMAPNFLVVTCIFPSLWEEWFEPRLDGGAVRRISEQRVSLEPFQPCHGLKFLEKQLEGSFQRHNLPSSTYPFTAKDVEELCARAKFPHQFIQAADAAFNCWLDGNIATPVMHDSSALAALTPANIDSSLQKTLERFERDRRASYDKDFTTEQDFFGRIHVLLKALLHKQRTEFAKATLGHFVMPSNLIIRSRQLGDQLCVAILNSHGRSFTSRIKNFINSAREGDQFCHAILMRDSRCNRPTKQGQELLDEFKRKKRNCFVSIDENEFVLLSALYDTLVAIEERTVTVGESILDKSHLASFITRRGLASRSQFLRSACKWSLSVEQAIQSASTDVEFIESATENQSQTSFSDVADDPDVGSLMCDDDPDDPDWTLAAERVVRPDYSTSRSGTAVLSRRALLTSQVQERALIDERDIPTPPAENRNGKPRIDVLLGDSKIDSSHAGVLGQLRDSQKVLGISLKKPQCIVLLGYMGSGKSYALGVLIENALLASSPLVRSARPMSVVAFNYRRNPDARFEYGGFAKPNTKHDEIQTLVDKYGGTPCAAGAVRVFGFGPELKRRAKEYEGVATYPIQFRPEELGAEHWAILMKPPTQNAEYMDVIRDIIQKLYYEDQLTYRNLETAILADDRLSEMQRKKAMNRLGFAARWVADDRPYEWTDVLKEGTLNVFDLRMQTLNGEEALKLCLVLTDLVRRTDNKVNKVVVFDEAHEYVDSKQLIGELENALTQIRHDGLSFVLASQFPERIPERIFKFMGTRFVFKIPTAKAINYLKNAAPNLSSLSLKQVANLGLEKGVCYVQTDDDCTDIDLRQPQLLDVRPRCSLHGGATVRHN